MAAPRTLKEVGSGVMIFLTEVLSSSTPISRIIADTASPDRYSTRPKPNGCSRSGLRAASLKPRSVITELPASDRLLKASAVIAIEPLSVPASSLPANSTRFRKMPTAPQSTP